MLSGSVDGERTIPNQNGELSKRTAELMDVMFEDYRHESPLEFLYIASF